MTLNPHPALTPTVPYWGWECIQIGPPPPFPSTPWPPLTTPPPPPAPPLHPPLFAPSSFMAANKQPQYREFVTERAGLAGSLLARVRGVAQQLLGLLTGQPSFTDNACVNVTPCKDGSILACSGERITPGVAGVGV